MHLEKVMQILADLYFCRAMTFLSASLILLFI